MKVGRRRPRQLHGRSLGDKPIHSFQLQLDCSYITSYTLKITTCELCALDWLRGVANTNFKFIAIKIHY